MKIGDIVSRKKYHQDIIFEVIDIQENICYLRELQSDRPLPCRHISRTADVDIYMLFRADCSIIAPCCYSSFPPVTSMENETGSVFSEDTVTVDLPSAFPARNTASALPRYVL